MDTHDSIQFLIFLLHFIDPSTELGGGTRLIRCWIIGHLLYKHVLVLPSNNFSSNCSVEVNYDIGICVTCTKKGKVSGG